MSKNFYVPNLGRDPNDPFARTADGSLVRGSYWLDLSDRSMVRTMTQGIGMHLTNDQKRAHMQDIGRYGLIDQICTQEVLPPED